METKGWRKQDIPFSVKKVLKREYDWALGITIMFTPLDAAGNYSADLKAELDLMRDILFGIGFNTLTILRTLKKSSDILSEKGR